MSINRPIVFLDTETTCLGPKAHPWEIATVVRENGATQEWVGQVEYSLWTLPPGTNPSALDVGGWLTRGAPHSSYVTDLAEAEDVDIIVGDERTIAADVHQSLRNAIVVGVGVHFDAAVLTSMFLRHGLDPEPWHYAIFDLKAATWGHLKWLVESGTVTDPAAREAIALPLRSERLAAAINVAPPAADERHTALGDARWAARWFDVLTAAELSR